MHLQVLALRRETFLLWISLICLGPKTITSRLDPSFSCKCVASCADLGCWVPSASHIHETMS